MDTDLLKKVCSQYVYDCDSMHPGCSRAKRVKSEATELLKYMETAKRKGNIRCSYFYGQLLLSLAKVENLNLSEINYKIKSLHQLQNDLDKLAFEIDNASSGILTSARLMTSSSTKPTSSHNRTLVNNMNRAPRSRKSKSTHNPILVNNMNRAPRSRKPKSTHNPTLVEKANRASAPQKTGNNFSLGTLCKKLKMNQHTRNKEDSNHYYDGQEALKSFYNNSPYSETNTKSIKSRRENNLNIGSHNKNPKETLANEYLIETDWFHIPEELKVKKERGKAPFKRLKMTEWMTHKVEASNSLFSSVICAYESDPNKEHAELTEEVQRLRQLVQQFVKKNREKRFPRTKNTMESFLLQHNISRAPNKKFNDLLNDFLRGKSLGEFEIKLLSMRYQHRIIVYMKDDQLKEYILKNSYSLGRGHGTCPICILQVSTDSGDHDENTIYQPLIYVGNNQ